MFNKKKFVHCRAGVATASSGDGMDGRTEERAKGASFQGSSW